MKHKLIYHFYCRGYCSPFVVLFLLSPAGGNTRREAHHFPSRWNAGRARQSAARAPAERGESAARARHATPLSAIESRLCRRIRAGTTGGGSSHCSQRVPIASGRVLIASGLHLKRVPLTSGSRPLAFCPRSARVLPASRSRFVRVPLPFGSRSVCVLLVSVRSPFRSPFHSFAPYSCLARSPLAVVSRRSRLARSPLAAVSRRSRVARSPLAAVSSRSETTRASGAADGRPLSSLPTSGRGGSQFQRRDVFSGDATPRDSDLRQCSVICV